MQSGQGLALRHVWDRLRNSRSVVTSMLGYIVKVLRLSTKDCRNDFDILINVPSAFQSQSRGFKSTYTRSKGGLNCWFTLGLTKLPRVITIAKILQHMAGFAITITSILRPFLSTPMSDCNSEVPINIINYYNQITNLVNTMIWRS